jgi:hypothetical protein
MRDPEAGKAAVRGIPSEIVPLAKATFGLTLALSRQLERG